MKLVFFNAIPLAAALASTVALTLESNAAGVVITVSGIAQADGQIGCSLFKSALGFPMDSSAARQVWLPASRDGVVCSFSEVSEGRYAVAVAHDLNGNRRVDTNFVGIPTEAWGVSGNARPTLRSPRWDEAFFEVGREKDVALEIRVAK